jgi:hypothetical protein
MKAKGWAALHVMAPGVDLPVKVVVGAGDPGPGLGYESGYVSL